MTFIVYKITAPNGRAYIGVTKRSLRARWLNHVRDTNAGSRLPLHGAIRKYGAESFRQEIITECVDARELRVAERALIAAHGTYIRTGRGYNCTMGGDGNWGWSPTKETRQKIGQKKSAYLRANPSAVRKMVEARVIGKKRPPRSDAHRAALSSALKGRIIGPEWRKKIAQAGRGRKWTPEQRAKMVGRKRGPMSEEQKAKISASKKRATANSCFPRNFDRPLWWREWL